MTMQITNTLTAENIALENARFMSRVYTWMTGGILLTALIAYEVGNDPSLVMSVIQNRMLFWVLMIA